MKRTCKLLTAIASLAFSASTLSAEQFNGPYIGLGAGWAHYKDKLWATASANQINTVGFFLAPATTTTGITNSGALSDRYSNARGIISAGFNLQLGNSPAYLGVEGFLNTTSSQDELLTTSNIMQNTNRPLGLRRMSINFTQTITLASQTSVTFKNPGYGIDFRPGFAGWFDTLISARIGVEYSRVTLANNNQLAITTPQFTLVGLNTLTALSTVNTLSQKELAGLRLGIGAEKHVSKHFTVFADYIHTSYGSITVHGLGNVNNTASPPVLLPVNTTAANAFSAEAKASLSSNQVVAGIRYYFS